MHGQPSPVAEVGKDRTPEQSAQGQVALICLEQARGSATSNTLIPDPTRFQDSLMCRV